MKPALKDLFSLAEHVRNGDRTYISLLVPSLLVAAIVLLPLAYLIIRTLGAGQEAVDILLRTRTLEIVYRSLVLSSAVVLFSLIISLPLAWILFRERLPYRKLWLVLVIVPVVIPSYVGGFTMVAALGPKGMFQEFFSVFGVERFPEIYGFWGSVIVLTLLRYPYMLLPLCASLSRLDASLEESARSLGSGSFSTYYRIVLPQIRPAVITGCILTFLTALSDFGAVSLLRYETFTWAIYLQYKSAFNINVAAVLSLLVLIIALLFLVAEGRFREHPSFYSRGFVRRKPLIPDSMGRWKIPAVAFLSLIVFFSLIIPCLILGYWAFLGISSGQNFPYIREMVVNTLSISLAAAAATVAASLPVAFLSTRFTGRLVSFIERSSYIGFSLPAIVVALALVFFGIRFANPIYQTHVLLVLAYVIIVLPVCIGIVRNMILQVNPNLENAGRSLGKGYFGVMRKITLPLVRPGIVAGFVLSFLIILRELPATLILSPYGFRTLATGIWSSTSEAMLSQGAVYSIVLIIVASVPMAIALLRTVKE